MIHPIRQQEPRLQGALELGSCFDLWQNLSVHGFLISFVLLCNFVFLLLCVEDLTFLMPGRVQLLLLEVIISQVFGDFNPANINFC